jgi:hypothetical protein
VEIGNERWLLDGMNDPPFTPSAKDQGALSAKRMGHPLHRER